MSRGQTVQGAKLRVFMMDLWATVPYYTAYLSRALLRDGVEVEVGSMTYYLDRQCFTARGLQPRPGALNVVGSLDLPRAPRRVLKLLEGSVNLGALLLRFLLRPPDVLHVQFLPMLRSRVPLDWWFVRWCRRRGIRTVLTVHDLLPHDTGEQHLQLFRELYGGFDALICHSGHIRMRLVGEFGVPEAKVHVVPHGPFFYDLEPRIGQGIERVGEQVVLWQGILFPYKGVDLLLEAWKRVEARSGTAWLQVMGTGERTFTESLERQARELGLQRVRFDFRFCSAEELVEAYRGAAAVVYPYRAITTSGALATGLALGKAIVASDLPVFREALREGESALLVDPHDPEQMAAALLRVLDDASLRERMEAAVRAMRFGERSWEEIAASTEAVYDAVRR